MAAGLEHTVEPLGCLAEQAETIAEGRLQDPYSGISGRKEAHEVGGGGEREKGAGSTPNILRDEQTAPKHGRKILQKAFFST